MKHVLEFNVQRKEGNLKLCFAPFESDKYNWILDSNGLEHHLKLSFETSLSLFLMTPQTWEITTLALLNEYVLGNYLPTGVSKRAAQIYLTWFHLPRDEQSLKAFQPSTWQSELMSNHEHQAEKETHLCVLCGIYCTPEHCSSDDEEKEERCLCGRKPSKCKCDKCAVCGNTETVCECIICEECKLCRCDLESLHQDVHLNENCSCNCEKCTTCGKTDCDCEDSSESVLFF